MAIFGKSYSPSQTLNSLTGVNNIPIQLKEDKVYKRSIVRFTATVNVTTAGAGVVFNDYGWYDLVKSIKLVLNGLNAFEWTPYIFKFADAFLTPNQGYYGDTLPTVANMELAGSYALQLDIPIHYNQPEVLTSLTTLLLTSTKYVKKPVLELVPNSLSAPFAAATTTVPVYNLSNIAAYLVNDEVIEGVVGSVKFPKFEVANKVFASSGTNQEFEFPANKIYRAMVFEVLNSGTHIGNPANINYISVYNGNNEILKDLSFADFQAIYMENYPSDRSTNVVTTGRVMMDFCYKEHTINNVVSTVNNTGAYFKLDLASACTINLYGWLID